MTAWPTTPAQVADVLHAVADRIAAAKDPTVDLGRVWMKIDLQPDPGRIDAVDVLAVALTGWEATTRPVGGGWQHGYDTAYGWDAGAGLRCHVNVYAPVDSPELAAERDERDRLRAEIAALREQRDHLAEGSAS